MKTIFSKILKFLEIGLIALLLHEGLGIHAEWMVVGCLLLVYLSGVNESPLLEKILTKFFSVMTGMPPQQNKILEKDDFELGLDFLSGETGKHD